MRAPRTLEQALRWRMGWGVALILLALNVALSFVAHHQIHTQTDAMLLALATSEARLNSAEPNNANPHVHGGVISLPSWGQQFTYKYALIHDSSCRVISATPQLRALKVVPAKWCSRPAPATFFTSGEGGYELRVGTQTQRIGAHGELTFLVGVEHQSIDRSLWIVALTGIFISLLAMLVVWGLVVWVSRELTAPLMALDETCQQLISARELRPESLGQARFDVDEGAPLELRHLSLALARLTARLETSWSSQQRFIAVAAHELRTPLTALRGELEVTLRRPREADEYKETLGYLLQDVERLERLAQSLLEAARAQVASDVIAGCELAPLMRRALVLHQAKLDAASLDVVWESGWDGAAVLASEQGLVQVFSNLIANVLMHAGASHISLRLERDEEARRWIVWIDDDGKGLGAQQEHFGEAFTKGVESAGYGLGSYVVRQLIESWGGELRLDSPGRLGGLSVGVCLRMDVSG